MPSPPPKQIGKSYSDNKPIHKKSAYLPHKVGGGKGCSINFKNLFLTVGGFFDRLTGHGKTVPCVNDKWLFRKDRCSHLVFCQVNPSEHEESFGLYCRKSKFQ